VLRGSLAAHLLVCVKKIQLHTVSLFFHPEETASAGGRAIRQAPEAARDWHLHAPSPQGAVAVCSGTHRACTGGVIFSRRSLARSLAVDKVIKAEDLSLIALPALPACSCPIREAALSSLSLARDDPLRQQNHMSQDILCNRLESGDI
jgi:hypothetical protein